MLELVERHSTGKARLRRLLKEVAAEDWCKRTLYLTPESLRARAKTSGTGGATLPEQEALAVVMQTVKASDTGLALMTGKGRAVAICPPFPLLDDVNRSGLVTAPIEKMLGGDYVIGVVLLRLGRYAVGVLRKDRLVASKTAGRYMKNRHRAGGQSQRRFERSRERLIRELYDKTCETAGRVFAPYGGRMDYILLGGENSTLSGFTERCGLMRELRPKILSRRLAVERPDKKTLDNIAFEAWKSRVYSFVSVREDA